MICLIGHRGRCYDQLVRLKKRHPERVVLLVGNRDANKMRFTSELDDSEMDLNTMTRGEVLSSDAANWSELITGMVHRDP